MEPAGPDRRCGRRARVRGGSVGDGDEWIGRSAGGVNPFTGERGEMPTYSYKAMGADGKPVAGVLTAENYQVVLRTLEEQSLFPVKVQEGSTRGRSAMGGGGGGWVKPRYLTVFYRQLADLLRAGVPMLRSLDVLAKQTTHAVLAELTREVREDVAGGHSLADAMEKHPRAFNELHVSMIRAGERGGFLEDVLERISGFAERQDELRNKLVGAIIYPVVLLIVATAVVVFLMSFVVPQLREFIPAESYNPFTYVVFGATDAFLVYYPLLVVALVALVVAVSLFRRSESGRRAIAWGKLRAPILGRVVTIVAVCRFCRILGTMLHNGVPILQALKIAKDSAGNVILAEEIEKAAENVRKGDPLSAPLAASGLFPLDVINMIQVAEEGNNLEPVLIQIADTNEARTGRQIDLAVRIVEPMLLLCMAVIVMVIAMALLLPILTMSSGIAGQG